MSTGKNTADDLEAFAGETTKLLGVVAELMQGQQAMLAGEPEREAGAGDEHAPRDGFIDSLARFAQANAALAAGVAKVIRDQADIIELADTLIKEQEREIGRLRGEVSAMGGPAHAEPNVVRLH